MPDPRTERPSIVDRLDPADLDHLVDVLRLLLLSAARTLRAHGHDPAAVASGSVPMPPSPYRAAPRQRADAADRRAS